ncbi:SDR family oxidoreductase [Paenibacillus sp. P26]|nr:SDR family oxidoreductase [Paenibacillus sp. P26]
MTAQNAGKTALVTGAAVGIGKGIAFTLASRGYDLAISYYTEEGEAEEVSRTIKRDYGRACFAIQGDLTKADTPARLVEEAVRELGALHVLVNNAGLTIMGRITDFKPADLDYLLFLNFRAPLLMMQAASRHMIERQIPGSIVNITSTRGERAYPGDAGYGGTKAALARASQSAALDLAPYGIRVNCVAPGATMSREGAERNEFYHALGRKIPLGRMGSTRDIGETVAWLVSEQAAYITGTTIRVDGGLILPGMPEDIRPEAGYGWGSLPGMWNKRSHDMEKLTIRDVKTILTAPEGINLVVVKIETSEPGLYGLGCATFTQRYLTVANAVEQYLKPFLIGKDAHRIEDLWQTAMVSSYWRNGPVLNNALSGVDMALWDIKGKAAGLPVYQLLGGKCREAAAVYRHADGRDVQEVEDNVRKYMEQGLRFIRRQMGGYGGRGTLARPPENALPGAYYDPDAYARSVPGCLTIFEIKSALSRSRCTMFTSGSRRSKRCGWRSNWSLTGYFFWKIRSRRSSSIGSG